MHGQAQRVGFLHPGAMGSSLAAHCSAKERLWVSAGRSDETRRRAADSCTTEMASIPALVDEADVIVSICPPAAAADVATAVSEAGFEGVYIDANAISPATVVSLADRFERFVDGAVIGPPATQAGTTRLYLSGPDAETAAAMWADSDVDARAIGDEVGAASALKMAYAAWTKGSGALLLAVRAMAQRSGVDDALLAEWDLSQPGLADRYVQIANGSAPKAWRFVGEMLEIATSFAAVDLPDGFHLSASEIYGLFASGGLDLH